LIVLKNVCLKFHGFELQHIDLHVRRGEYFVIVGPTGSGKSSVLNCIAGHYRLARGDLWIGDAHCNRLAVEQRGVGYVFQAGLLFPHLDVADNIAFGLKMRGGLGRGAIAEAIDKMGNLFAIGHLLQRSVHHLSGGEKQRVALARSMVCAPKALLLDEPFSSVDRNTAEKLMIEFKKIQRATGQTVVHVTHNQEEAMMLADRICVMNNGRIIQTGVPNEILSRPQTEFVATFFGAHNILRGVAAVENGRTRITRANRIIYADTRRSGDVVFSIRPEDIVISRNGNAEHDRGANTYAGTVRHVIDRGILYQVLVDVGFPVTGYCLRKAAADMGLAVGARINLSFATDAVHIIEGK